MSTHRLIRVLECVGFDVEDGRKTPCRKPGLFACSNCKLVKYCGKEHQKTHWPAHKMHCKDPLGSKSLEPQWVMEGRKPNFMVRPNKPLHPSFGGHHYIWGNTPAIDCLNLGENEGSDGVHMDFRICFAASRDVQNMIRTINGLPENYDGDCAILLNDRDPAVFDRNAIIVYILLMSDLPIEEAAEMAVHISYSLRLTSKAAEVLHLAAYKILEAALPSEFKPRFSANGVSLQYRTSGEVLRYLYDVVESKYNIGDAEKRMREALLDPSRQDHRDRYFLHLKDFHRVSASEYRKNGMVLPFDAHCDDFIMPNRTLFSVDGSWLSPDASDPLHCWEMKDVLTVAKRFGAPENDLYGALFFYAKTQYSEFARRARKFRLSIFITSHDISELSLSLLRGDLLPTFKRGAFARVETSNIADRQYLSIQRLLKEWGQLLDHTNPHAAIITHFMNWVLEEPDASARNSRDKGRTAMPAAIKFGNINKDMDPKTFMTRVLINLDLFYDNAPAFEKYMKAKGADSTAHQLDLTRRTRHMLVPKRRGLLLAQPNQVVPKLTIDEAYHIGNIQGTSWTDRFAEFVVNDHS